jgi:amino acid transporter
MTITAGQTGAQQVGHLQRDVNFWGLLFVSLGSIIGSGWLLGALTAATVAGPASLLSWIIAAAILAILALVHAELGAAYPVAGGTARYPFYAFGPLAGFTAGWMSWVQAVALAPVEVEATLSYSANIGWVKDNVTILHDDGTLTGAGIGIASVFMLVFVVINLVGVRLLSDTNSVTVIWKTLVPLLTVVVLLALSFHGSNFSAGGSFAPFGVHGVFAALPAGVVFALQGFEQAIQVAGEARNPQRDMSRAVLVSTITGTIIYLLLEVAFIGALDPHNLIHGWANPIGKGDFGPYATIATGLGAGWLAIVLYIDAVISPAGTGMVYMTTSSRITYAMGREGSLPRTLGKVSRRGVPLFSIILAFVIGEIAFLPFPSWQELVGLITSATSIMYAFGPVSLHALRLRDPDRPRPYRTPFWQVISPAAFAAANLIIYWSGFEADWKLGIAILVGLAIFAVIQLRVPAHDRLPVNFRNAVWVWVWLAGLIVIGKFGQYGGTDALPNWWDELVVIVFALAVYYWAVRLAVSGEAVAEAVARDAEERLVQDAAVEGSGPAPAVG